MSVISIDEVVRAISNDAPVTFRRLSDSIMADLVGDQIDALMSAFALGGRPGACVYLARHLRTERMFARIRPGSRRGSHMLEGQTYVRGCWYSVVVGSVPALLQEPERDTGKFTPLFEVTEVPPPISDDGTEIQLELRF